MVIGVLALGFCLPSVSLIVLTLGVSGVVSGMHHCLGDLAFMKRDVSCPLFDIWVYGTGVGGPPSETVRCLVLEELKTAASSSRIRWLLSGRKWDLVLYVTRLQRPCLNCKPAIA